MKRLTLIMFALTFCLPAKAEILVFKTATGGWQIEMENGLAERKKENGYFVINVNLANPDGVSIAEAYHLHYESRGESKIQYTTILDTDEVEIILVGAGGSKKMLLRYFDQTTGTYMVSFGTATLKNIGNTQRYAATSLTGHDVWRQLDYRTGSASVKFRLDLKATRNANIQPRTVTDIIDEYERYLEETKGYIPE